MVNPFLGVFFHWIGGLAAGSFYLPYRGVKKWAWETYWLVGGFFSWIIAPLVMASLLVPGLFSILGRAPSRSVWLAYIFGVLWGIGGLTFGLTVRYLGMALGYALALGYCAAFGTLAPPIYNGQWHMIVSETWGRYVLLGIGVCLAGIAISGLAGMSKELELSAEQKKSSVREFNFIKGLIVATFAGILSGCFNIGLDQGTPIAQLTAQQLAATGRSDLWQNLPVLVVVLWGGFTTNFVWCVVLNIRNRSGHEYFSSYQRVSSVETPNGAGGGMAVAVARSAVQVERVPLLGNYVFSAVAGVTWYLQFFFYSMGATRMGDYGFASWTLHMASIIIFSTLWGVALHEWKGSSRRTHALIAAGLIVLMASTMVVGYGYYVKAQAIAP
jgi:L-rhamnose-H+ transport protein